MLQNLTQPQVEQALAWLASPHSHPVPQELKGLNQVEWVLLNHLLENLLDEKERSPVQ